MVLFTLITISLDASACIAWWAVKNTLYGTYCLGHYLIIGPEIKQKTKEEELIIELRTSVMHELAELNNKIINPHIIHRNDINIIEPINIETIPGNFNPLILNEHTFIQTLEPITDYIEIQNNIDDDFVFIGRE